ncbi:MAG: hypothetical protein NWF01_00980 [Candidatus Bathyarchaeota archaeon]|nr:hypothetical protein [Candidatus Bathyarchaeota archaeon]
MNKLTFVLWLIILSIIIIEAIVFLQIARLPFVQVTILGATHSLTHWIGWAGALYIAFTTPLLPIIKHKKIEHLKTILNLHMIGNLLAVLLVSIHFVHQITRPVAFYPDLGTGIVLYSTMVLLVATGMLLNLGVVKLYKQWRFLHPAFAVTFYIVIVMHIIQNA